MQNLSTRLFASITAVVMVTLHAAIPVSADEILTRSLYEAIDPERPGYGPTDYPGNLSADIPKSHAMVLLAEVQRTQNGLYPDLPSLAPAAGTWLLDNFDANSDGVAGWGVPVAWDAYGDGSENPADTEYTISTAIAVDALLTWMEKEPEAPRSRIMKTVQAALLPFLDQRMRTSRGLAPYSFVPEDRKYNTYNPAGYLAGQLQRFSRYAPNEHVARQLQALADDIVEELLRRAQRNPDTGSLYWFYSEEEGITNDVAHAAYIVHGLMAYVEYQGALSARVPLPDVVRHLEEFYRPDHNSLGGWPYFETKVDRPARSYGLGMVMSLLCGSSEYSSHAAEIAKVIPKYLDDDGTVLRHPTDFTLFDPIHINEYRNYLYRGMVACDVMDRHRLPEQTDIVKLSGETQADREQVSADGGDTPERSEAASVDAAPLKVLGAGTDPAAARNIELFANESDGHRWRVMRKTITDALTIQYEHAGRRVTMPFAPNEGTQPIFRAAASFGGTLDLVYFDNIRQANLLYSVTASGGSIVAARPELRLPSFEDPTGGTYEMIPKVFVFKNAEKATSIAAGPVLLELQDGEIVTNDRQDNCSQIIEAVHSGRGFAALCRNMQAESVEKVYSIRQTGSLAAPDYDGADPIFDLRIDGDKIVFRRVTDAASLQALLGWELRNAMQGGWMQYGISNTESRIPWDQIYYLNGLIDLLDLARDHGAMRAHVAPYRDSLVQRIDEEIAYLAEHWIDGRYKTRAFSVDRSPQLFAVQTSRLLLLLDRLRGSAVLEDHPDAYFDLHRSVHCLADHIEALSTDPQPEGWMFRDAPYLKWPRGSAFYFDGLNVPYNHQNEWAYAVLSTPRSLACPQSEEAAGNILSFFLNRESFSGLLPAHGVWQYWWGQAYDGWDARDALSINLPEYGGDLITAWISFRSIDIMSLLSHGRDLPEHVRHNLIASAQGLLADGKLYPFVNYALREHDDDVVLNPVATMIYARAASSWEFQNMAWAHLALADRFAGSVVPPAAE